MDTPTDFLLIRPTDYSKQNEGEDWDDLFPKIENKNLRYNRKKKGEYFILMVSKIS